MATLPLYQKIAQEGPKMNKRYPQYLNKIKAKQIVQELVDVKVAKLVKVLHKPSEFKDSDCNPAQILKASRGSGYCHDLSGAKHHDVVRRMYAWETELRAKGLPVEFLIEEKINDAVFGVTGTAVDYKFFCFHGKPAYFLIRFDGNRNFYDLDYKPIKLEGKKELPHIDLGPMIAIVEKLCAPFPFVRIDLYLGADGIYFGEYTFHVRAGAREFDLETERKFGALWRL